MITKNITDLISTINAYEESLTSALSVITTIKGNIDIFQEKLSQLSMVERINPSTIEKSLTPDLEVDGADTRKEADNATGAAAETATPEAPEAPAAAAVPNISADDQTGNRRCWKQIIPELLKSNSDLTTAQIIQKVSESGIINATVKKDTNCVRSALKALQKTGLIKRVENRYGSPWTLV